MPATIGNGKICYLEIPTGRKPSTDPGLLVYQEPA